MAPATVTCRIYNGMTPETVTEIFTLRLQGQYNLKNWYDFTLPNARTVNCGVERQV